MSSPSLQFSKAMFALVTGTGRGIGKFATQHLAKNVAPGSKIVGISNLPDKLKQVRELCEGANESIKVELQISDLAHVNIGEFNSIMDNVLTQPNITHRPYESALIVHNAGTVGEIDLAKDLQELSTWQQYYDLNLFSAVLLNTAFIKHCKPYIPHLFIVNISSAFTVQGIPKLSMYCSAKAARNAYFTVLASEEPDISVLNYSPGAARTSFLYEVQRKAPEIKPEIISVEDTVRKLFEVLTMGNYKSGSTIDFSGKIIFK